MKTSGYPRLCGGTFLTLILQALQPRMKAREHYDGESDGLTDPEVLMGLIKVVNPDYPEHKKDQFKKLANNYKACKTSEGVYLPFNDEQILNAFDGTVRNEYNSVLNRMSLFVKRFIDLGASVHKDTMLVRALIDLIQQDQSIGADEEFFIGENGEQKKKATLGDLKEVCLPAFLLGVWHYVVMNRRTNSVGQHTYDEWCPANGRARRKYKGHMGESILENLKTYMIDSNDEAEPYADSVETIVIDDRQREAPQNTVNSRFVFTFNQYGNNGVQIGHIENYHANKQGSEANE